jgi:hypothetical protein
VGGTLQTRRQPGFRDRQMLDQVAGSVELLDVAVGVDKDKAMAAAGIQFDPPAGALFVGPGDPAVPRVRLMGGQAGTAWYLDVYRVPLIGQRTCSALVQDHALSVLEEVRLREQVESVRVGSRETAWIALSVLAGQGPTVQLLASRTDERTALFMIARHEPEAQPIVRSLCRAIAEGAKVASYGELMDIDRAQDAGRRCLQQIAKDGLNADFGGLVGKVERFVGRSPGVGLGVETRTCEHQVGAEGDRWQLTSTWKYKSPGPPPRTVESIERYRLAGDGLAYTYTFRRLRDGQPRLICEEDRGAGSSRLTRSVATVAGKREETIETDETFTCEPVAMRVAARMLREPQPAPTILSTTETYARGAVYWVMTVVGRTRLPGGPLRESALAVRIQRDYDPAPIIVYFDDKGVLKASSYDGVQWSEPLAEETEEIPAAPAGQSPRHRSGDG